MVSQAQILNLIEFGQEMAHRNDIKDFGLNWPFLHFSLILRLKSGKIQKIRTLSILKLKKF